MLPGFRFLFATVVLAISVLVFGLGAAALLRAAHEEFVNLPSWRLAQQPVLAPQFEMSGPTLAMLRIEALAAKPSLDKPRPQAIIRDLPRDFPEARPAEAAAQDRRLSFAAPDIAGQDIIPQDAVKQDVVTQQSMDAQDKTDAPREAEQVSSPAAPQAEQPALNAQASVVDPAPSEQSATEQASTDEGKTEAVKTTETRIAETRTAALSEVATPDTKSAGATASAPASSESKSFEAKSFEEKTGASEASEPRSTERVATIDRSSEATASATLPGPVVKKVRRTNVRAIRQRRAAIARARAAARARAIQQQGQASDPFGLFGTAPRSAAGSQVAPRT